MKGVILYKSKYGATRQYMDWLASELQLPLVKAEEFDLENLSQFEFVIIAGSVYVGKWMLRDWVKENLIKLRSRKIFFLFVCGTPSSSAGEQQRLAKTNIPEVLKETSDIIFLRGRVVINKLSWLDRFALRMASGMEKDPIKKKEMRDGYDDVSRTNLVGVIRRVKAFVKSAAAVGKQTTDAGPQTTAAACSPAANTV
jgi:menaquinone-dependent protoporphyrinogen IX oxidase